MREGKIERYVLKKDFVKFDKLQKDTVINWEEEAGNITKIIANGEEIYNNTSVNRGKGRQKDRKRQKNILLKKGDNSSSTDDKYAKAPYNFVPVNDKVVEVPSLGEEIAKAKDNNDVYEKIPSFDRYHASLYTGYIDLKIEALTPLYIRDTYTEDEKKALEKEEKQNPDFFSPGGIPRIPGSSLRGMIRNLVEIVSYSKMEFAEDKNLFYRFIGDKLSSIRREYFSKMGNNTSYKFKAGYLKKEGNNYVIIPAKKINGKQYKRIEKKYDTNFDWYWQEDGSCITVSGPAINGKTQDWLINPPEDDGSKFISLTKDDINLYKNDKERSEDANILNWFETGKNKKDDNDIVPCFYLIWKNNKDQERIYFGHTAYFRLPYDFTIREHLPDQHNNDELIDLTTAIFGKKSTFAGRVYFEDAIIRDKDLNKVTKDPVYLKILSNPKPTTFQHYLEQKSNAPNQLNHWNCKEAKIRGYKLYWHRETPPKGVYGWGEYEEKVEKDLAKKNTDKKLLLNPLVKVIKEQAKFTGRIRFENLTALELGALLFVLPKGCAHKIGMGKPLGLGSIRIEPSLIITERKGSKNSKVGRYDKLFSNKNWHKSENDGDIEYFKRQFAQFMLEQIGENTEVEDVVNAYWNTERMQELRAMLNNTNTENWLEITRYMEIEKGKYDIFGNETGKEGINEFEKRLILLTPVEVLKKQR